MNILDILNRNPAPSPWSEGDKIPWNEPGFSARMLKEHLNPNHDAASRRPEVIDQQVAWIHTHLLGNQPAKILDLGCGPGLYTSRLARLRHQCLGIDFSPASIAYASAFAADESDQGYRPSAYLHQDIRSARYGSGYNLVMLIFGEFNIFTPRDACLILAKANAALKPGGILLLEAQQESSIQRSGTSAPEWYSSKSGLFSDKPHLCLTESFWDPESYTATRRYFVIDGATGGVSRFAETAQAYTLEQYYRMLEGSGFTGIELYPSLTGDEDKSQADFFVFASRKRARTV